MIVRRGISRSPDLGLMIHDDDFPSIEVLSMTEASIHSQQKVNDEKPERTIWLSGKNSVTLVTSILIACLLLASIMWTTSSGMEHVGTMSSYTSMRMLHNVGCTPENTITKRIVIVGSGAAGLTAAKRLHNAPSKTNTCLNTQVIILEATSIMGGRIGKDTDWIKEYPMDLGASWIYDASRLSIIAQEPNIESTKLRQNLIPFFRIDNLTQYTISYSGRKMETYIDGDRDKLWANYTWYDFFEQNVANSLQRSQFEFDCPVDRINWRRDQNDVSVSCGKREFLADHVIVTASLEVLKDDVIDFYPSLPPQMLDTRSPMWKGFKVFFEFKEKFYDDYLVYSLDDGELDWWDYSLVHVGRNGPNILGGYYMGEVHNKFESMSSEAEVVHEVLKDLDQLYGNQVASNNYIRHKLVNWAKDFPYVRGTYSRDVAHPSRSGPQVLWQGRLWFAGEAFPVPREHIGWVDGAALSGLHAAEILLSGIDSDQHWSSIPTSVLNFVYTD